MAKSHWMVHGLFRGDRSYQKTYTSKDREASVAICATTDKNGTIRIKRTAGKGDLTEAVSVLLSTVHGPRYPSSSTDFAVDITGGDQRGGWLIGPGRHFEGGYEDGDEDERQREMYDWLHKALFSDAGGRLSVGRSGLQPYIVLKKAAPLRRATKLITKRRSTTEQRIARERAAMARMRGKI